jgi:acetoin utilization protein AcuB
VVTPDGTIVGMLSDRELLANPWDERNVSARMATPVLTATPDASIRDIARVLIEERIGAMPIADDHGRLVGLLTRTDILRAVVARAPLELWT